MAKRDLDDGLGLACSVQIQHRSILHCISSSGKVAMEGPASLRPHKMGSIQDALGFPICISPCPNGYAVHWVFALLLLCILIHTCLPSLTSVQQANFSLLSLFIVFWVFVFSEDSMESTSIGDDSEAPECHVSVLMSGAISCTESPFVSTWPELETSLDDASDVNYEHHNPPGELLLLLDEGQTPPEIRDIVRSSLKRPKEVVSESSETKATENSSSNPKIVDNSNTRGPSSVTSEGSSSDQSHSPSGSNTSLVLSTSRTTNSSNEAGRPVSKKAALSAFFSSKASLIGCVTHLTMDPLLPEKNAGSQIVQKGISLW
jgi:hypothetical protein